MTYSTGSDGLPRIEKAAAARLDYSFDFKKWLQGVGDTIETFAVTASPTGGDAVEVEAPTHAGGIVTAFISGGAAGVDYQVTCNITTAAGRIDARTITIAVVAVR